MPSFQEVLDDINKGAMAFNAVLPSISQTGIGSLQSIGTIVGTAGAVAASSTNDPNTQAEIVAAAQTGLALLPLIFSFFHKKAATQTGAAATGS